MSSMVNPPRRALLAAAAAAFFASGCQQQGDDDERRAAGREAARAPEAGEGASEPTVELLSAGSEPRRELRYALAPGSSERVTVELDMEMAMTLGDAPSPPVQLPRMRMVLDLTVDEALEDAARYTFELTDAKTLDADGVDPSVLRAIEQGLFHAVGTGGSAQIDDRGFIRFIGMEIGEDAPAETRQMMETTAQQMEQLSSPLPAEPVGVGARWEVIQHLEQNGIALVQTSVMTLESVDGDSGRVVASTRQHADPQVVDMPGAMAGARAELLELRGRRDGELAFDLTRLMPVRGQMRTESESRFEVDVGSGTQPMTMHMDVQITLEGS